MKNYYDTKPSEIVQRFKFDFGNQKRNETFMDYEAELRPLAQDCNYGNTQLQRLRDRPVCEINGDRIQRRLLAETDLTLEKALGMAVSNEIVIKNALDLQNATAPAKHNVLEHSDTCLFGFFHLQPYHNSVTLQTSSLLVTKFL